MTVKQQIETILENRRKSLPEFSGYKDRVEAIREFVNRVSAFKSNSGWLSMVAGNEKLQLEWNALIEEVDSLNRTLHALQDGDSGSLVECLKRVKREYLNIGCIGPWRQGKSTVIAKLTSLSDYVIPRSQFRTCTGTTINVFNGNQVMWENGEYVEKDGDKAVVFYHSFNSICKTINDYLSNLGLPSMPYASTVDSFIANCSKCYQENQGKPGTNSNLKAMLDNYLLHAADYAPYLKSFDDQFDEIKQLSTIDSQKRLRPLISYYEKTDEEYCAAGIQTPSQVYYVLAVKKVNIYTHFLIKGENGSEEVGKIQFVDTPGIGEHKLEVAHSVAKALREELDIAICLRKVSNQKGITPNESFDFHRILKQNTFGRKPENWVFYLYNKEGNVPQNILTDTFNAINDNLKNQSENGLEAGQIVGGINLRYDMSNNAGNHVDFIDAENDVDNLQKFFMNILVEMAATIADSDEAFYKEARESMKQAEQSYIKIRGLVFNVAQYLPTFDDREKILKVIKDVNNAWNNVDCPQSLNENVNHALSQFYNEAYGVALAKVLNVPDDKITLMEREIAAVMSKPEMTNKARLEERAKIAHTLLFPYIQDIITENVVAKKLVSAKYKEKFDELYNWMAQRALSYVETTNLLQQMEEVKLKIWRGLMVEGKLGFNQVDEKKWLVYFVSLLEEGGADFASLRSAVQRFDSLHFDLGTEISKFIKTCVDEVSVRHSILMGESASLESIQESVYNCLIGTECDTKATIQSKCRSVVNSQLSLALSNFVNQVWDVQMTIIPEDATLLTYRSEFEQLIKFYNKYAQEIFAVDEQAAQKGAVLEWNALKLRIK